MDELTELLTRAATAAADYRRGAHLRDVGARIDADTLRERFGGELPREPTPPGEVLRQLRAAAQDGLVATVGPRFFGLVVGGSLPAATAADMLATGWDQCAFNAVVAPAAAAAEQVAGEWLADVLGLPEGVSVGFVTGGQAANTVGLACARHHLLARAGWDVERDGLAGAPKVRVVASRERHATIDASLRLLGFGTSVLEPVAADSNGAIDIADLERVLDSGRGPVLVCLQAGNVNTGACDDLRAACGLVRRHGGWSHVDGAFGLWAAASPATAALVDGVELADSWACDGHKWLNVPYDSGFAFCSRPDVHAAAMSYTAAYLAGSGTGSPALGDLVPESSRRARGFAVWAALRELGRDGLARLILRCHTLARRFASALADGGAWVANEVVLNEVLVRFGDDEQTERVIEAVQREGTCWLGGTTWRGNRYLRIAVSNHSTTEADVDRSAAAILRCAADVRNAAGDVPPEHP
ncbi:glutamate/tyrosine decarboxylase-like PLP-dependent enzyme [Saccharomonospora amisosensis]|uniref:Glutamate/tyrosine decarboxylase-like PLP-dependent enzyme n=1 Tax=Saccharomonospora amisosensis TaxID=1128677 RepID=A0A7X5UQK4_9PSEU|nr:pyridoxal-dependent decarboxylase [Saccharomonospora amisosensis]NIJ12331.1 glutamate/tyrosine decarboxylase-like PLP-dependent enzyme [Saccharomonospora amisosensis]